MCLPLKDSIHSYVFKDALVAFKATQAGKGADGKGIIKAMISGPDLTVDVI